VYLKVTSHLRSDSEAHALLERAEESNDPYPGYLVSGRPSIRRPCSKHHSHGISRHEMLLAPDLRRCFHLLHTSLSILLGETFIALGVLVRTGLRLRFVGSIVHVVGASFLFKLNVVSLVSSIGRAHASRVAA
jgi:hypothetical protein